MEGTPGVDICGATADCGAGAVVAVGTVLLGGARGVCPESPGNDCDGGTTRNDSAAAMDDGSVCDSEPVGDGMSAYVSLGLSGVLGLRFPVDDLRGCDISVSELFGEESEGFETHVCATSDLGGDCLHPETFSMGGEVSFSVPRADDD
jgi:hypothetical protein